MLTTKQLLKANKQAGKNKGKNVEYIEYMLHRPRNLHRLQKAVDERTLVPSVKAYVVFHPVVREVFSASIDMCTAFHLLQDYIRPVMERELNGCVFNNRVGRGLFRALEKVHTDIREMSEGYTSDCWLSCVDVQGYFPNANQQHSYDVLEGYLKGSGARGVLLDDLLYILRLSIFLKKENITRFSPLHYWDYVKPEKSVLTKPEGTGAMAGELIEQLAMTAYHDCVIKWFCGLPFLRVTVYGDDLFFVTTDKQRFLREVMPELRRRMGDIGCTLHPRKRYCQHYTKGGRFCSQWVKFDRTYCGNRTINNFQLKAAYWCRRVRVCYLNHALSCFNSYTGVLRHCTEYGNLRRISNIILPRWGRFMQLDKDCVFRASNGYKYKDLLSTRFNIKKDGRRNDECRGAA